MHAARPAVGRREFIGMMGAIGATTGAVLINGPAADAAPASRPAPVVVNGGFENGLTGWHVSGTAAAAHIDSGGVDGTGSRLTHWSASSYTALTSQRLSGVRSGWLTVGAWVKSGGELNRSTLELSDGHHPASVVLPDTEQDDGWVYLSVSALITGRTATVSLRTVAAGNTWASIDAVIAQYGRVSRIIRGADLSSVPKNEDHGAGYRDARDRRHSPEHILAAAGANLGRLKVWVDPADGYNDKEHVVEMADRIKAAGMQLLIDFHYSDTWTDPGAQHPPAAWKDFSAAQLTRAVRQHTLNVLGALRKHGIVADYVQVGNEINPGMLWPLGQTWDVDTSDGVFGAQWANLGDFLTAGAKAVKQLSPRTKVLLHGSLRDLQTAITTLSSRYDKDVVVVETAYPWTLDDNPDSPFPNVISTASELAAGYPATRAGQAANFRAIQDAVASAPGGRGLGTVYWEPAWTSVIGSGWDPTDPTSGDAWENQAFFDWAGRPLPAMAHFAADRPAGR